MICRLKEDGPEECGAQNEKACRGRRCGRLSEITEQRLGGGVPLLKTSALWEEEKDTCEIEALREEVHRFDDLKLHAW